MELNAAGMSPKAVEEAMAKEAGDYSLRLVLRNDASENIEGSAIGLILYLMEVLKTSLSSKILIPGPFI